MIGIDSHTLNSSQGKKWLVLGLVWQLIKMFLFKRISVTQIPGLVNLLKPGEDISELMKLSPEQLLLRWVNFQLEKVIMKLGCQAKYFTRCFLKEDTKKKGKMFAIKDTFKL